jgi:hypothetical protein
VIRLTSVSYRRKAGRYTVLRSWFSELQDLGPDFVCGYLSAIDSERDPRNLMYLFERLPKFYQNFPPGHLLEDAFEAASCYFPVDFRAVRNSSREYVCL